MPSTEESRSPWQMQLRHRRGTGSVYVMTYLSFPVRLWQVSRPWPQLNCSLVVKVGMTFVVCKFRVVREECKRMPRNE